LLRRGQLKQITKDQSLVNQLIEAGHLTEDEAEAFEHSNIILQALGTAETVNVDLTFVELRKGDRLMLCSDGLSGLVHAEMLRTTLDEVRDPVACCTRLIELAEAGGGHDNITCIVADFDGDQLAPPDEGESFGYMQYPLPLSDEDSTAFTDEDTVGGQVRPSDEDPSSLPTQRPASPEPMMRGGDDEADDTRANALWILAGALALIGALGVWWTLDPKARNEEVASPPAVQQEEPAPPAVAAEPSGEEVQVNVYTDVEAATLLVNGESQGELSAAQSKSLKLKPGAYRFEAQAGGSPRAVTVVTVRGDMPMDVFLKEPSTDEAVDTKKAAREEEHEPGVPDEPEDQPETAGSQGEPERTAAESSGKPPRRAAAREAAAVAEPEPTPSAAETKPAAQPKPAPAQPVLEAKPAPMPVQPKATEAPAPRPAAPKAGTSAAPPPAPDLPSNPF
jgi:hypothetical protein